MVHLSIASLLTLKSSKTVLLLIGHATATSQNMQLLTQLPRDSAGNLCFTFGNHFLTFFDHISAVSKSCCYHIRQLCSIHPYIDFKTASTIATSVHSELDYCNSRYYQSSKIFNKFRTLLLMMRLRLQTSVILLHSRISVLARS